MAPLRSGEPCIALCSPGLWYALRRRLPGWRAPGHCVGRCFWSHLVPWGLEDSALGPVCDLEVPILTPKELAGVGPRAAARRSGRVLRGSPILAQTRPAVLSWCPAGGLQALPLAVPAHSGLALRGRQMLLPGAVPRGQAALPPALFWQWGPGLSAGSSRTRVCSVDRALWAHGRSPSGSCTQAAGLPPGPAPRQHRSHLVPRPQPRRGRA